ncbi:MAG: MmcQ/YjbR family DNA-binding protein [Acidobacteria bacterium]|nr:MmcQ/YjbR family DNA-binding protein [Acidobacteriota bacterium]
MHLELDARGKRYLEKFRKIALAMPGVVETESFGHPWFRVGGVKGKMLSVFGQQDGQWSLCFKAAKEDQGIFLKDPRFVKTPYVGQHGWVSLKLDNTKPDWNEIAELLEMSYRNSGKALK